MGEDGTLKEDLGDYYLEHTHETGTSIDSDTHLFRLRCVECFMGTGTPLARLDKFRALLEREGHSLTSATTMSAMYVPKIHLHERELLIKEMLGELISISFDGTTRLGEAINVISRW